MTASENATARESENATARESENATARGLKIVRRFEEEGRGADL